MNVSKTRVGDGVEELRDDIGDGDGARCCRPQSGSRSICAKGNWIRNGDGDGDGDGDGMSNLIEFETLSMPCVIDTDVQQRAFRI